MLPFLYEFHWDIGHIIFFGVFYGVLAAIGLGLFYALVKTISVLRNPARIEEISHHD